jgi:DNA-directed RNA polymerase specialized sigma24 family protein
MSESTDPRIGIAELYIELAPQLERIVRANVEASSSHIEEACQNAWAGLLTHRADLIPGTELGWLATTATREALALTRSGRRDISLEAEQAAEGELVQLAIAHGPEHVVDVQERLAEVRQLPARQHRMVMLQGFGYRYEEIAEVTGDSLRTVERQLHKAHRRLAG